MADRSSLTGTIRTRASRSAADPRPSADLSPGEQAPAETPRDNLRQWTGFAVGIVGAVLAYLLMPEDVGHPARLTAAVAVLMAAWWMTQALPLPVTALIPLALFPVLGRDDETSAADVMGQIGASYGNPIIFLFLGGFMLALAMQRWNLHKRLALLVIRAIGTKPTSMIGGFMIATALLSMWVSNTATAVMMLPIGVSVLLLVANASDLDTTGDEDARPGGHSAMRTRFGTALMLGIAYAASIGSLGTIISTPPNVLFAAHMREAHGVDISFGQWMLVGVPLGAVFLFLAWVLLAKVVFRPEITEIPGGREMIGAELAKLGRMTSGEIRVLVVFVLAALGWVLVPLLWPEAQPVSEHGIAIVVALLLFILPAGANRGVRLLDWSAANELPWGVLLLFGGGLALSSQFTASGLSAWIGAQVEGLAGVPVWVLVLIVCIGVLVLTELSSNTATAATLLPVAGGVSIGLGIDPLLLAFPVAVAATCSFMLPVATPPNAIAYGSGYVTAAQMLKGGFWLNVIALGLVSVATLTLATWVFGIGW
ncbi:DASS family sodium-coupled anion symporter [Microbacterium betulae]|uniref:Sodium-dependent dicarboxylate transporter SdcS n=1 Tax=Microbacterium betulae TaxID=2981139 RepID=A0AA97FIE4_9MICO|nr:DASS family sodium-coupled anion symporter [Microbacterium sp. AB]WOF23488.1 DASS family sodium-coupled anion symporter [Microbacterium sp. AB]